MEILTAALQSQFTWGLLLGLLIAAFIWKAGFTARRQAARELKRVEAEIKDLQSHLNTQLKINASGNETLQNELKTLKQQNETLRVNNAALQQKPGRAEQRLAPDLRDGHPHDARAGTRIRTRLGKSPAPGRSRSGSRGLGPRRNSSAG